MDIKDSYLHGTVGVVKSISVTADKLSYKLADIAGTIKTVTLPVATTSANGLMSSGDKTKLDNLSTTLGNYVTLNTDQEITGIKTFTKQLKFTVALGTSPFLVTSTTKVTNLHASFASSLTPWKSGEEIDANNLGASHNLLTLITKIPNDSSTNIPTYNSWQNSIINVGLHSTSGVSAQLFFSKDRPLYYRSSQTNDWKQIAFTDSDITGNAATATKLKTKRKLWGLDFDGTADVSGNMTGVGTINTYFNFQKGTSLNAVLHAENIFTTVDYMHLYVSNLDKSRTDRPLVLQHGYGKVGIGVPLPTQKLEVNGNVKATSFIGNLDGTYVNKLTNYKIADAIGSIAATDSLNTALGKLEFKTDFIYNDLFGTDNDDVINKWHEIVDFIDSVAEGSDITDEFVTRKTDLTITGVKTFRNPDSSTSITIEYGSVISNTYTWGGWARDIRFSNTDTNATGETTTVSASFGVYGAGYGLQHTGSNQINYLYLAHQNLNHNTAVFKVYSDKATISGNEIYHKGNDGPNSGLDADTLDGYHANATNTPWNSIPIIRDDGVMEVGSYIDFHYDNTTNSGHSTTLVCTGNYGNSVNLPSASGTLALTSGTIDYANKLKYHTRITTLEDFNGFLEPNVFKIATFNVTNLGFTGNDGMVLSIPWSSTTYGAQITIDDNPGGLVKIRLKDSSGWSNWHTFLTSKNYTSYVNETNFPGLAGVRSVTINNDYLRVNTNGTNADLTIPYATRASYLKQHGKDAKAVGGLPYYDFETLNSEFGTSGTGVSTFYLNLVKKLIKTHSTESGIPLFGTSRPNSLHITLFRAYTLSDYNNTGLPLYCTGLSIDLGRAYLWGTINGIWSYNTLAYTSDIPTSLKNPNAIKFKNTSGTEVSYDGSTAVNLTEGINYATRATSLKHTSLTTGLDLNTLTTEGVYSHTQTTVCVSLVNGPANRTNGECRLEVINCGSSEHTLQLLYTKAAKNGEIWYRMSTSDDTWSTWKKIAFASDYLPLSGGTMTGNILLGGGNAILGSGDSIPAKFKDSAVITPEVHSVWLAATGTGTNNVAGGEASGILLDGNTIQMWTPMDNPPKIIDSDNGVAHTLLHSGNITKNHVGLGNVDNTADADKSVKYATSAGSASKLGSTTIVSSKAFSLVNTQWTDVKDASDNVYTFTNLTSGTYAIQITCGNLVASGIMSVYKNIDDTAGDEIPLHVYHDSSQPWRPYLRTSGNKLLISSNDASATSRTVTIKIALIL